MNAFSSLKCLLVVSTLIPALDVAAQTVERVDHLNPAGRGSGPYSVVPFQGQFYFQADDGVAGRELWQYDGVGVSLVADIRPLSGSSNPSELTVSDGVLYFTADDGVHGNRLWSFDGAVTSLVDVDEYVSTAQEMISFNDDLYFRGVRFGDVGIELFRFDGVDFTAIDVLPGTGSSFPQHITEYGGALYFNAAGAPGQGAELWRQIYFDPLLSLFVDRATAEGGRCHLRDSLGSLR